MDPLPQVSPLKTMYALLRSLMRATYTAHLSVLDLITRKISDEEYRA
jgi:hypothetical protein